MQGITITINADTAQAAERLKQFFSGAVGGVNQLTGAGAFLRQWGAQIAGALSVGALVNFERRAINAAEGLKQLQQETGVSVRVLSSLREAAEEQGKEFDQVRQSVGLFANQLGTAISQGGQAAATFRDLLGTETLRQFAEGSKTVDDVLLETVKRFNELQDGPRKTQVAMDLFGRSGRELIPVLNQLKEGMAPGVITPELAEMASRFNIEMRKVANEFEDIFIKAAPALLKALEKLDFAGVAKRLGDEVDVAIEAIGLGRFGEYWKLTLQSGVQAASNQMLEQIAKWGKKWTDFLNSDAAKGNLWTGAKGVGAGVMGLFAEPFAMLGVPGARKFSDREFDKAYAAFDEAGIQDGVLNHIADAMGKGLAGLPNEYAVALDKFRAEMLASAAKRREGAPEPPKPPGGNGSGNGTGTPLSDAAKALVEQINKAYAEATQSRLEMLELEERALKEKIKQDATINHQTAADLTQKTTILYAARRQELRDAQRSADLEIQLAKIQGDRQSLNLNGALTEMEKKEKLLGLLRQERELIEQNIKLYRDRLAAGNLSDEARLQTSKQLQELESKRAENAGDTITAGRKGTFSGEFSNTIRDLQDEWGSWAAQAANAFKSVFESAVSSISDGITGLIMRTKTWGEALLEIGTTILTSIVSAIVQMGVRWVATQLMMAIAGKAIMASATAASAPIAAAQSAIWATPATLATISSYGAAAAAAPGFIAMAQGMTMAQALAAFEKGGFTGPGGRGEIAGLVHKGEYVFSAPAVDRIGLTNLEGLHQGASGSAGAGGSAGGGKATRLVVEVADERRARDLENDPYMENLVLKIFDKNRHRYGV